MKKLLTLTLITVLLSGILTSCKQSELPPELTQAQDNATHLDEYTLSPYADTNTTKRCYAAGRGTVYGDNYYYISEGYPSIKAVPLSEAVKYNVIEQGEAAPVQKYTSICLDPLCDHNTIACPTVMGCDNTEFLIEATESRGDLPVIYYYRSTSETGEPHGSVTINGCEIVRFDVAAGEAKQVAFSNDPIKQLMAYGDYLYYTTMSSDDGMYINSVKKTGGSVNRLVTGADAINLIGANDQGAYFNDDKGSVYALNVDGDSFEKIFTASEYYVLGHPGRGAAELNMFVEGEYLYYFADYRSRELPWSGGSTETFNEHSIRRVRLDAPNAEGEIVAESVYDCEVYGVYDGVLYYGPFDVRTNLEENPGSSWCHSNGTINGVNLETLETFVVISDCGFNFGAYQYYVNDRCIIGDIYPYRDVGCFSVNGYWCAMLLDFETGAIYPVIGVS